MPSRTVSKLSGFTSTNFRSFSLGSGSFGLAGEIAQNAHDEREFFQFDGAADFDVVGDMNARGPNPVQFVLCALSSHSIASLRVLPKLYSGGGLSSSLLPSVLICGLMHKECDSRSTHLY